MRAGREDSYASADDAGRYETLVHDQRIRCAAFIAEGIVANEARLILRRAVDRTASKEVAAADGMRPVGGNDLAAGLCDVFERRFLRKHDHHAARQQDAALVRPVRMKIDDRPAKPEAGTCLADSCNDSWKTAAVVEMPVRQENVLDRGEIDPEPSGIVEPDVWIGADIEQHAALPVASPTGNQHRESVTGAAQLIKYNLAVMPFVLSAWSGSCRKMDNFLDLGQTLIDA